MCGIAGSLLGPDGTSAASVARMLSLIRHRGPDDGGEWEGSNWRVGMRRLSILDVERGHQPMCSRDGAWVIVFNGEIYNFRDLGRRLAARGVALRTRSDTEVLVELIAAEGVLHVLEAVEGMFAFAAIDLRSGELWLARDRFGEKPLFVDRRGGGFAFCSELAPLIEARRGSSRRISPRGVAGILRHGHPWPGDTAVEGIVSLRPAEWLRRSADGGESSGFYWAPPDRIDEAAGSLEAAGRRLLDLLDESVANRLIADVPLGLFLSGGIDSGAVAASAARFRPDIEAITVGFDVPGYDEREYARCTASHVGIRLTEAQGTLQGYSPALFDELLFHHGQPFGDTSAVPTRAVSLAARRRFKVVLSGDGGDELLAGYLAHSRNVRLCAWTGGRLSGLLADLLARAVAVDARTERVARTFELVASVPNGLLPHVLSGVFSDVMLLQLVEGTTWQSHVRDHLEMAKADSRDLWASVPDATLALSLHQLRHSMPQDILTKVDRMSMAESLEVRAPFLDSKLAAYALSLPAHLKIQGKLGKFVLRHALRSRLPEKVLGMGKRGFSLPVQKWLGQAFWTDYRNEVDAYCSDSASELNTDALRKRAAADAALCRSDGHFRALHRSVLLYGFLRWRRTLMRADIRTATAELGAA